MKKKPSSGTKIFIGIPSYKGIWLYPFRQALAETIVVIEDYTGQKVSLCIVSGDCYIQAARNRLAREFFKSGADYWLSLDDDVVWKPEEILSLLKTIEKVNNKKIYAGKTKPLGFVSGVYPFKEGKGMFPVTILQDKKTGKPISIAGERKIIKAYGCGLGMSFISRELLEKIKKEYKHLAYVVYETKGIHKTEKDWFDFFPQGVYNGLWAGEDFAFCRLIRDIGQDVWVYPDMNLRHYKNQTWFREGNFKKTLGEINKNNE